MNSLTDKSSIIRKRSSSESALATAIMELLMTKILTKKARGWRRNLVLIGGHRGRLFRITAEERTGCVTGDHGVCARSILNRYITPRRYDRAVHSIGRSHWERTLIRCYSTSNKGRRQSSSWLVRGKGRRRPPLAMHTGLLLMMVHLILLQMVLFKHLVPF